MLLFLRTCGIGLLAIPLVPVVFTVVVVAAIVALPVWGLWSLGDLVTWQVIYAKDVERLIARAKAAMVNLPCPLVDRHGKRCNKCYACGRVRGMWKDVEWAVEYRKSKAARKERQQ